MCWPYPEFVLTGVICIEKALRGTEIVFVLTVFLITMFYCINILNLFPLVCNTRIIIRLPSVYRDTSACPAS